MPRGVPRKDELAPIAAQLRAEGLLLREIGARLGVRTQTVHAWLADPDGSRLRARKDSYRGVCETCGEPTSGCNGRSRAARVCGDCLVWTDDAMLAAIDDWARERGGIPPSCTDWRHGGADHPAAATVVKHLGWDAAVRAAGYEPRIDRRPETQADIERRIAAGETEQEVADSIGCTVTNISNRLRTRGLTAAGLRAPPGGDR